MLLCLTRPARVAYLLGDLLGITDVEGAQICGTTPQRSGSAGPGPVL